MSKQPNELFVVLIRARNLTPQNRKHNQSRQADPFVLLSCAGKETRSTTKKATLNPRWTERYTWDADDSTDVLDIEIRDACAYTGADFLGRVGVEMDQLRKRQALRKFLVLKNADDYRDEDRGEIELLLHWRHNPHFTPKKFPEESPRRSVFIEPYAIFMHRLHQTRSWVVCSSILGRFGPRRGRRGVSRRWRHHDHERVDAPRESVSRRCRSTQAIATTNQVSLIAW